jgi:RHS repeat-associated protein
MNFYDGNLLLAEKVGSQIQKIYINDGTGIIGMVRPIYNESNTLTHYQRLYYLYDSLGSVSCVTGENGLPLQNYTYSPFGTCLNVTNDPINSLQFVGRYGGYLDSDTGLTYFWHMWYDSRDGRWISSDPLNERGILSGKIGNIINSSSNCSKAKKIIYNGLLEFNNYSYILNNPLRKIDPLGLSPCEIKAADCYKEVLNETIITEAILSGMGILCVGGCAAACAGATIGYPVCFDGCAALCGELYEITSIASVALHTSHYLKCKKEYNDCKDEERKKECK